MLIKTFQKRFRVVDLNQNKTQDLPEESADIKKKKKDWKIYRRLYYS